jgi:hypothetical protein
METARARTVRVVKLPSHPIIEASGPDAKGNDLSVFIVGAEASSRRV